MAISATIDRSQVRLGHFNGLRTRIAHPLVAGSFAREVGILSRQSDVALKFQGANLVAKSPLGEAELSNPLYSGLLARAGITGIDIPKGISVDTLSGMFKTLTTRPYPASERLLADVPVSFNIEGGGARMPFTWKEFYAHAEPYEPMDPYKHKGYVVGLCCSLTLFIFACAINNANGNYFNFLKVMGLSSLPLLSVGLIDLIRYGNRKLSVHREILQRALAQYKSLGEFLFNSSLPDNFQFAIYGLFNPCGFHGLEKYILALSAKQLSLLATTWTSSPIDRPDYSGQMILGAYDNLKRKGLLTEADLTVLAGSRFGSVQSRVLDNPLTNKDTLMVVAKSQVVHGYIARQAYESLDKRGLLSEADLTALAGSPNVSVQERVAENPQTNKDALMLLAKSATSGEVAVRAYDNLDRRGLLTKADLSVLSDARFAFVQKLLVANKDILMVLAKGEDYAGAQRAYEVLEKRGLLTEADLTVLAGSKSLSVPSRVAENPLTNKDVLMALAKNEANDFTARLAYDNLNKRGLLSEADLTALADSKSAGVLLSVLNNPLSSKDSIVVAKIISGSTSKSRVIVSPGVYQVYDESAYMEDDVNKRTKEVCPPIPETSHHEYTSSDIKFAVDILAAHPAAKRQEILQELQKINSELAAKLE
ncbi:MAG: hypothetical protein NTZ10_06045 [Candidatus Saganbacteria bacterium]|nr:hypothetical protein [Candidatus Saganbacteria bacterium]